VDETEVWLWPEGRGGEHLRGWMPDETRSFPKLTGTELAIRNPDALITGQCAIPLETGLPSPLADWLTARLRQTSRLSLRLTADLPTAWHRFPYEWLTLDGAPLHDRLRVWRNVPRTAEPPAPVRPAPVALLNLWPGNETIQPHADLTVSPVAVHRYDGRREVEALLRWQDVRTYSALCLIVHGSEQAHTLPFCLPDSTLWALPPIPLPPLVILLACSDSNGNLIDYAATLLQRGAVTVLAAIGKPDPRDAAALLPRLLQGWLAGEPIGTTLAAAQTATAWRGTSRFCLLGSGDLRMSDVSAPVDQSTERLVKSARAGDDAVWCELLPRLTLRAFQTGGDLSPAPQSLRDHLADWAKAEYRRGHYARAVAATVEGLRCAAITDEPVIRLLGSLINLLLDLNLPELAQTLFDLRDRRLDSDSFTGDFAAQERFKGLDVQGRRALRQGQVAAALAGFRRKRRQAPEHGENGRRELAWLLYAAALTGPVDDDARYAEECRALLADRPEPGSGNDDVLYLLRALAAWAWRRGDSAAWKVLVPWLPELKKRLESRQDTGPVGFTLSYLHLYQRAAGETLALPDWETIGVGLQDDRYFFELAVFSYLLERPRAETKNWLNRYQQERRAVIEVLQPANLPVGLSAEPPLILPDARNDQESRECQLLLSDTLPDWSALVAAHLLPW